MAEPARHSVGQRAHGSALRGAFVITASMALACSPTPDAPEPETPLIGNPPEPTAEQAGAAGAPNPEVPPTATAEVPAPSTSGTSAEGSVSASARPTRLTHALELNPKDPRGRPIKRAYSGPGCFVDGVHSKPVPPGTEPPQVKLACPAALLDPAFDQCLGGVMHATTDKTACACFLTGNPPPPAEPTLCPKQLP